MRPTRDVDWNALGLAELYDRLARADAEAAIERALAEDLGPDAGVAGDVTTAATIDPRRLARATVVSRSEGVLAGLPVAESIARRGGLMLEPHVSDGARLTSGTRVATFSGPLSAILAFERTVLNFLTLLSGNATLAARFVDAVRGTRAAICDTRKTLPGLRTLQKYATRCGGARLHRIGLFDAVLLKDNHLGSFEPGTLARRVREASARARAAGPVAFVECEVDSLEQFDDLLGEPLGEPLDDTALRGSTADSKRQRVLDVVLLDNMAPAQLAEAVRRRDARAPGLRLEASGGIRLDNVRAIAETGVDRISIGAITHSAPALDLGLDLELDRGVAP